MRKLMTFHYRTLRQALDEVQRRGWYAVQYGNMVPRERFYYARTEAERDRYPDQENFDKPAAIKKWRYRKSAGADTSAMYVGELELADQTTIPLAEIDKRRDRKLFRHHRDWTLDERNWGADL